MDGADLQVVPPRHHHIACGSQATGQNAWQGDVRFPALRFQRPSKVDERGPAGLRSCRKARDPAPDHIRVSTFLAPYSPSDQRFPKNHISLSRRYGATMVKGGLALGELARWALGA